ncbi:biotin transporter BioY [Bacillus sp. FJAT-45066]|uniref:biotin transporter BioY n=1 Tax=Bacillus sp. FJAT-45066 TaxID=2011010 RepID=UPI000BB8FA7A|nr:biotin transporter BioY [Bacillus sp. FJAT-45066]
MSKEQLKLRTMIIVALFAAITGVLAQLSIPLPFSPVPITGQTLAIGLAATILGARYGTYAIILYLLIGAAGVPVFAQMKAGLSIIVGPTGGYLVAFIPTALFIGWYLQKTSFTFIQALIANTIAIFIPLTIGTAWLAYSYQLSLGAAMTAGFTPFLIGGVIKAVLAAWIGILVRERLISANLLFTNKYAEQPVKKVA